MAAQKHKGKIALITGANKGIGYELARQLGKEGATVLIAARNAELGDAAAGKLKADGADAYFIELDVTKPETIAKAAETVRTRYGRLDILKQCGDCRSGLGSLTWNEDPKWPFAAFKPLGYNSSKAILNMMTVQLAWELRDTAIKVNTVNTGYTATDLNGNRGTQTLEEGAAEAFRRALAPDDAPTGGFFETGGVVPW